MVLLKRVNMKKILVIGCSETGKNSFTRRLRDEADLPFYYLDMIWHKLDKTGVTRQEFNRIQSEIPVQDEWIIDGNYDCIYKKREAMPWVEDELDVEFG